VGRNSSYHLIKFGHIVPPSYSSDCISDVVNLWIMSVHASPRSIIGRNLVPDTDETTASPSMSNTLLRGVSHVCSSSGQSRIGPLLSGSHHEEQKARVLRFQEEQYASKLLNLLSTVQICRCCFLDRMCWSTSTPTPIRTSGW
jgi:hypothetical protein